MWWSGGNVITRLQEELPHQERFFTEVFDSAILYEGEHALLWLIEALNGQRAIASVPNLDVSRCLRRAAESRSLYGEDDGAAAAGFRRACRWITTSCRS